MCDFKVGDEVVCVDAGPSHYSGLPLPTEGATYTVRAVYFPGDILPIERTSGRPWLGDGPTVWLLEGPDFSKCMLNPCGAVMPGYRASRFRKVRKQNPRLTIETFLTIKPGFEEPRRVPNKTPVRV